MTSTELKKRAIALAEKTKIDSVTPEEVGQLSNDIVEYIEDVERNGSTLGIRKTYTSVSAMEADSTAPKDDKGVLLRRGMLVNIYNQNDPSSADNGKVFSFQNPGWAFRGTVEAGYATKDELAEVEDYAKKATSEYNVSVFHPTSGTGGTNRYDLAGAIAQVPSELRTAGLKVSFLNSAGKPESWEFQGGSWAVANFIKEADGGNKILTWVTDAATTRKQVSVNERKAGMQISYTPDGTNWINEQFVGKIVSGNDWVKDGNWVNITRIDNVYSTLTNYCKFKGYYVIKEGNIIQANGWYLYLYYADSVELVDVELKIQSPGSNNYLAVSYFDEDFKLISGISNDNAEKTNITQSDVVKPEGCKYVGLVTYSSILKDKIKILNVQNGYLYDKISGIIKKQSDTLSNIEKIYSTLTNFCSYKNGYFNTTGDFKESSAWRSYLYYSDSVELVDVQININGPGSNNYLPIAYFDEDFNLISGLSNDKAEKTYITQDDVVKPEGCKFIALSYYSKGLVLEKIKVLSRNNEILYLSNRVKNNSDSIKRESVFGQYSDKKIAFCGDSLTAGAEANYQGYANRLVNSGIFMNAINVARGGTSLQTIYETQLPSILEQMPDVNIISISTCTNNYPNNNYGEWFVEEEQSEGVVRRTYTQDNSIRGMINQSMIYIREHFPTARVVWLTPIRKYNEEQGDDMVSKNGVFLSDYRDIILEIPKIWNVSVLDMWSLSGLDPHIKGQQDTFFSGLRLSSGKNFDGVHVGPTGGLRMYETYLGFLRSWFG